MYFYGQSGYFVVTYFCGLQCHKILQNSLSYADLLSKTH